MSQEKARITLPVGRLVSGDAFDGRDKDAEGRPLVVKNGPNAGQPRKEYYMGVAIPKNDPEWPQIYATIQAEAAKAFPTLFQPDGTCINPQFAFKITDGDSQVPNGSGIKPCDREGYAGHWVVHMSNGFPPKVYKRDGAGNLLPITNPEEVKRGYYVRASATVGGNGSMQQPGIFINGDMVLLVAVGEEIFTGANATDVFGAQATETLPAGAQALPTAGAAMPQPQAAAMPQPQAAAGAPVQPAPDFVENATASAPKYLVNGVAYEAAQLIQWGYTPESLAALPRA